MGKIARAQGSREYLQQLIQTKGRMIVSYSRLAGAGPPARRGRPPGKPPKAQKAVRRAKRRRVRRVGGPAAVRATSQRFASLSVTNTAEQILREAGKAVHLREITAQLMAGGKKFRASKPEVSVLTMISKDKRFKNTGKNMWTLA